MPPGILAGHVDVELVMCMLDDGDAQTLRVEMRDQPRQQRRLPRAAPACKADDFHSSSVSASDLVLDGTTLSCVIASEEKQSRVSPWINFWIASLAMTKRRHFVL